MRMNWEGNSAAMTTLVEMYPNHTATEIAKAIGEGCDKVAVQKRGQAMKLRKSDEFCRKHCSNLAPKEKGKKHGIDKALPE